MEAKDLFPEYDENIEFEEFMKNGVNNTKTLLPFYYQPKIQNLGFERYCTPTFFFKKAKRAELVLHFFLLQVFTIKGDFILSLGRDDEELFCASIFYRENV